ncbi:MAG: hypothetical protein NTV23_05755 [Propionibacteriales bacterium]|nr:hypothetical protein [Propionibacteriales bacterium]
MATADVNWMLSSSVQSGSALVAIIGGLLGSRYVALDAEQRAAERRLVEVREMLARARRGAAGTDTTLRLEGEEAAAAKVLARSRRPSGFGLALEVLAYIALTAILVPLTMMVWEPEHLPLAARLVVCLGFGSGVLLLFRYLFVYAAVLGTHSERTVMPVHVIGLLAPTRRRRTSDH